MSINHLLDIVNSPWLFGGFLVALFVTLIVGTALRPAPDSEPLLRGIPPSSTPSVERLVYLRQCAWREFWKQARTLALVVVALMGLSAMMVWIQEHASISLWQCLAGSAFLSVGFGVPTELLAALHFFARYRSVRLRIAREAQTGGHAGPPES